MTCVHITKKKHSKKSTQIKINILFFYCFYILLDNPCRNYNCNNKMKTMLSMFWDFFTILCVAVEMLTLVLNTFRFFSCKSTVSKRILVLIVTLVYFFGIVSLLT